MQKEKGKLKGRFVTGVKPTQQDFGDLMDSYVHKDELDAAFERVGSIKLDPSTAWHVDAELDAGSKRPVQNAAVAAELARLEEAIEAKGTGGFYNLDTVRPLPYGARYTLAAAVAADGKVDAAARNGMIITFYDGGQWRAYQYSRIYDAADAEAPSAFADPDNWKEFESGGGFGAAQASRIVLARITPSLVVKKGAPAVLRLSFDHVMGEEGASVSTGLGGTATVTVARSGYRETFQKAVSAGVTALDVTRHCDVGITSVRVKVEVDTGERVQSAALAWTVSVVDLRLSTDLRGDVLLRRGETLRIGYSLESGSSDAKSIACYVDGAFCASETRTTSVSNGTIEVPTASLVHGPHLVVLRAEQKTGEMEEGPDGGMRESLIYSNAACAVVGVRDASSPQQGDIVTCLIDAPSGADVAPLAAGLSVDVRQYDTVPVRCGGWRRGAASAPLRLFQGDAVLQEARYEGAEVTFKVRHMKAGTARYRLACGDNEVQIFVAVEAVDVGVGVPSGRTLFLDGVANGHANDGDDRASWSSAEGGIATRTTFSGFQWAGDGWHGGALRLMNSARAEIGYAPLMRTASGGATVGFKYRCTPAGDDGARVISCVDANGRGFYITPAEIVVGEGLDGDAPSVLAAARTEPGGTYSVAIVVWPDADGGNAETAKNGRMVYIAIDGVVSGGFKTERGGDFLQSNFVPIALGADGATADIYRVWAYQRALDMDEILATHILDLDGSVEAMAKKALRNEVVDADGYVSPESLPDGTRVMVITGTAYSSVAGAEMASVLAAGYDNEKSKYFPVEEILTYVKGSEDRSRNFVARANGSDVIGGVDMSLKLRLQGTSSLAYPVKNYRIYTKKSEMYVGVNPDLPFSTSGEKVSGGLFAMRSGSAPVAVWCLKADYAESSGSHNTGMARMVDDTLKQLKVLTPAQRDADATRYSFDVRTTVDGEPCALFFRRTLGERPQLLGKFNFNNDKSTEAVFGFKGIPGHHDAPPLDAVDGTETSFVAQQHYRLHKGEAGYKQVGDLTECWEFLNNENAMGSFLDDDFDADEGDGKGGKRRKWTETFEARYPDNDGLNDDLVSGAIKPYYLSTLVAWVKSTKGDAAKFRDELRLYFDVRHLCHYFVFTQLMACLDQMVKNMMLAFWHDAAADGSGPMGKVRGYMIFYDCDTILGLVNNGRLRAPYDVDRQTVQLVDAGGNDVYYFAGHESVLWNNLQAGFGEEIREAYAGIRGVLTNGKIYKYFDEEQADRFCERIFNLDALNKYVSPQGMGEALVAPYRDLMQGSRKSHRHYFLENRLSVLDNQWRAGEFATARNEASFKGISAAGSSLAFTLAVDGNVEVRSDVGDDFVRVYPSLAGTPRRITKSTASAVGTIIHVYGTRQMRQLDVSEWDFDQLNLGDFPKLEEFIFNDFIKP